MSEVLLVDIFDKPIGKMEKFEAHKTPNLHRAFSVFLYHDDKILIQKRAKSKYHSGGLWANACCSHPLGDVEKDAQYRLYEELGIIGCEPKEIFSFVYMAKFNDNLFEYEYDHVLLAEYVGEITVNKEEAEEAKWVNIDWLKQDLIDNPNKYAIWFLSCAPKVIETIKFSYK